MKLFFFIMEVVYVPNVISEELECNLIQYIDEFKWSLGPDGKRLVQQYGYIYDYNNKTISDEKAPPIPELLSELATKLNLPEYDQMVIDNYLPGEGITPHTDSPVFGNEITIISLGSGAVMHFTRYKRKAKELYLEPRSMLIMKDEARKLWKHEIKKRKSDVVYGTRIPRNRRISITYRKCL